MNMMADGAMRLGEVFETVGHQASIMTDRLGAMSAVASSVATPSLQMMNQVSAASSFNPNNPMGELNALADRGIPVFDAIHQDLGLTRLELNEFMRTQEGRVAVSNSLINSKLDRVVANTSTTTLPELNSNTNFNISGVTVNNGDRLNSPEATRYIEGIATRIAYNVLRQNTRFGGF